MTPPKRIHFMGIGGSAISAVAQITHQEGLIVSGCDLEQSTPYLDKVKKLGIPVSVGHDLSHLHDTDLLIVTPAAFFQSANHPELVEAKKQNKVMTWQEFLGRYIQPDKKLIAVAGTHGKSTTTALAGLVLEQAGLDPTVVLGATIPNWKSNTRLGTSSYFVIEADEYYHNFLSYHPDIIILNNIEMDHPEYFHTIDKVIDAYQQFINNLKPTGLLIYNLDSPLISQLTKPANSISYSLSQIQNLVQTPTESSFDYFGYTYHLTLPGLHNISNVLGLIHLSDHLGIHRKTLQQVLTSFTGVDRRLQLYGTPGGIAVLDDYANLPSAFSATLAAAHQKYPNSRIWAIIEPHTYSRLRTILSDLAPSLTQAHQVIISQIFPSREPDPGDFTGADIAKAVPNSLYIPAFPDIVDYIKSHARPGDVVLVMGSGLSYKLTAQIYHSLAN